MDQNIPQTIHRRGKVILLFFIMSQFRSTLFRWLEVSMVAKKALTEYIEEEVSSVLDVDEDSDLVGEVLMANMTRAMIVRPNASIRPHKNSPPILRKIQMTAFGWD
jgi:hypothetical protein